MSNFLDQAGLSYLWTKILAAIESHSVTLPDKLVSYKAAMTITATEKLNADTLGGYSATYFAKSADVSTIQETIQTQASEILKAQQAVSSMGSTVSSLVTNKANSVHAAQHAKDGSDPITLASIGAAPGGFGWGEAMKDVLASDAEDTYETYCGKLDMLLADMPDRTSQLIYTRGPVSTGQYSGAGNIVAVLSKILGTSASLIGLSPDPRGTTNGLWRMLKDNGNWQPVEWINPPMTLGTEYRTTERYMGKPVYKKLVTTGALPSATGVVEYFPFGTDYNAGEYTVFSSEYHIADNSNDGGWTITIPKFSNGSLDVSMGFSGRRIDIYVNSDKSSYYGFALLKYTKTTD